MSSGRRIPYRAARAIADDLVALLAPACERIDVAGSVRRGADDVGDIELVAVPKVRTIVEPDGMFATQEVVHNDLSEALDALLADGVLMTHPDRPARGDRYARVMHVSGLQVDLFSVLPPAQFGVIYLIRTGPSAYSQELVTLARRRHHHVADGALHRGSMGCPTVGKCEAIDTPEETDVYLALGLEYLNPQDRR